ncbi:hypothetical protein E2C01_031692 [Portunus trituberculatus]|uniref:Uncharacterized protein n=1 Tax=Portunus trituberculatus TaxID=210409 RepID=A0A5B7EYU4_PORTR|nr:hypothetical protein [Portunus trituberculatus]
MTTNTAAASTTTTTTTNTTTTAAAAATTPGPRQVRQPGKYIAAPEHCHELRLSRRAACCQLATKTAAAPRYPQPPNLTTWGN